KYSEPSDRTRTLKHSPGASSIGDRISFCSTVGSITVGLSQSSFSFAQALKLCGRLVVNVFDMAHQTPNPSESAFPGSGARLGKPRTRPNSRTRTPRGVWCAPPSGTNTYGQRFD